MYTYYIYTYIYMLNNRKINIFTVRYMTNAKETFN